MLHIWAKTEKADHGFLRLLMKNISHQKITDLTNKYSKNKRKLTLIDYVLSKQNKIGNEAKEIIQPIMRVNGNDTAELIWSLMKIGYLYKQNEQYSFKTS